MSVAFRRESDEQHLEPKFDIPIPPGPNLVTVRGLAQINARVADLTAALAATADDAERTALKRDLKYWTTRQTTAQVAPAPSGDEAAFGMRVRYRLDGAEAKVDIVGSDEAEPAAGRIAFTAPLARALIGGGVGDVMAYGDDEEAIAILEVAPIPAI